jgi:sn-glycerol 3-phosphate transport system permease protein
MVEKPPILDILTYIFLALGICVVGFPIFYALIAATLPIEMVSRVPMPMVFGDQFWINIQAAWHKGNLGTLLFNSFVMAAGITLGKIAVSMLGAFSIVYFDYRLRTVVFASVFCTLMLPVEVRILPTYEMAANLFGPIQTMVDLLHIEALVNWFLQNDIQIRLELSLLDSYPGLILPLVASATCTFLFRQFYLTVPRSCAKRPRWTAPGICGSSGTCCCPSRARCW